LQLDGSLSILLIRRRFDVVRILLAHFHTPGGDWGMHQHLDPARLTKNISTSSLRIPQGVNGSFQPIKAVQVHIGTLCFVMSMPITESNNAPPDQFNENVAGRRINMGIIPHSLNNSSNVPGAWLVEYIVRIFDGNADILDKIFCVFDDVLNGIVREGVYLWLSHDLILNTKPGIPCVVGVLVFMYYAVKSSQIAWIARKFLSQKPCKWCVEVPKYLGNFGRIRNVFPVLT
jgi:hypothetical protein